MVFTNLGRCVHTMAHVPYIERKFLVVREFVVEVESRGRKQI